MSQSSDNLNLAVDVAVISDIGMRRLNNQDAHIELARERVGAVPHSGNDARCQFAQIFSGLASSRHRGVLEDMFEDMPQLGRALRWLENDPMLW